MIYDGPEYNSILSDLLKKLEGKKIKSTKVITRTEMCYEGDIEERSNECEIEFEDGSVAKIIAEIYNYELRCLEITLHKEATQ